MRGGDGAGMRDLWWYRGTRVAPPPALPRRDATAERRDGQGEQRHGGEHLNKMTSMSSNGSEASMRYHLKSRTGHLKTSLVA